MWTLGIGLRKTHLDISRTAKACFLLRRMVFSEEISLKWLKG
jgi:hypothetical protein